jgi:hypothetical protein
MTVSLLNIFDDSGENVRGKVICIYSILVAFNIIVWIWAIAAFREFPILLGTAMLAYSFGLRHAFDADHIAAVDNVTRKLMQQGRRPVAVGLFFSLGHSTIVVGLSVALAITATALQTRFDTFKNIGAMVGTGASAFFLFAIAFANFLVLISVYRTFQKVKNGGRFVEEDLDLTLAKRGLLGRLFRRLFRVIERSWQMYPLGVLFGLGFDTATEVGLLGISATQASQGLPIWVQRSDGTPKATAVGQAELIAYQVERFEPADDHGDNDGYPGDRQVIVELADRLEEGPAVGAEHQDAVGRIDQGHAGCEQRRKHHDRPKSRPRRGERVRMLERTGPLRRRVVRLVDNVG